ncbi:hypothetical protein NLX71_10130 [Paenibacillus sp. MZ04-78.2]|uniref:hypothetical protein n=1 Tax=Paenibacillus sp. MZ04-78.2 TaxID=2962034 RepID=UPI0020B8237E|nr:hypothetical protein [Paenibacillus sp. MZ04-78.2]MCP3773667.1 hypothetical protein [Paenibacillus sp. MZ04-78.2]
MAYEAKTNWQLDDTVTEQDMNRIERGLKDAYENSLTSPPPEQVNLGYGLHVVDAKRTAPLENVTIKGRTLVNLLGRDGNCEDVRRWTVIQSTLSSDTTNKVLGNSSLKITSDSANGTGHFASISNYVIRESSLYLLLGSVRPNLGEAKIVPITFKDSTVTGDYETWVRTISDTTKFSFVAFKFKPNRGSNKLELRLLTSDGASANFDAIALYEITEAEFDAIDNMTPEQIAAKWPYVDDMKNIYSPYIVRYGENLLFPMSEATTAIGTAKYEVIDPYKAKITTNDINQFVGWRNIPAIPDHEYTFSFESAKGGCKVYINEVSSVDGSFSQRVFTAVSPIHFRSKSATKTLELFFGNADATGTYIIDKPMLTLGATDKPFKSRNDDYLFFPNVQLASNVDGKVYDTLFQRDGKYWKLARFKTVELSGNVKWGNLSKDAGVKAITTEKNTLSDGLLGPNSLGITRLVKYNGKLLADYPGNSNIPDIGWIAVDQSIRIAISNVDSGWGDLYDPSPEDIGAYFNGWRMCDTSDPTGKTPYNKSGTQGWFWVTDSSANPSFAFSLPTSQAGNGWKPYTLQYQLAKSTPEEIIAEGGISLHEGFNQVEIGNGLVVREKVNPFLNSDTNTYINNIFLGGGASKLKNKTLKILKVYRNELEDDVRWIFYKGAHTFGQSEVYAKLGNYDPSAAYTVTYLAFDQYSLTCNVLAIQGEYAGNVKTVVDTLAASGADLLARVSVLENTKAQKIQGQWITPTLLNGWVSEGSGYSNPGYYKDQFGIVHLSGVIRGGTTSTFTALFYLPAWYRPKNRLNLAIFTFDVSSTGICSLHIEAGGAVKIGSINCKQYISLDGISFLAEQ